MASIETIMRKWYQDWSNKPATQTALKKFKAVAGTDPLYNDITLERIAIACFNAFHYSPEHDPGEKYREAIQEEKNRLTNLKKAARVLASNAKLNSKALMWADVEASNASGVRITRYDHSEPKAHHLVMHDYFAELEKALKSKLPEIDGGPFLGEFTKGNLIFDKPISRGRKVTAETMLAYELSFYLRMHTAERAEDSIQNGQRMPNDEKGDPCFPVVAAFCNAVFENGWDAKQIGDNVRDLKNVGLTDWQGVNSI